jgi:NADH-quinone oxidoreductase subunit A
VYFDFGNVLIFLLFGALFVIVALFLSRIIRPASPSAEKQSTYECGEIPLGGSWIQFNLRFYVIALIFLIFEVEVIFLFPWAVVLKQIGVYALVEMFIFIGILLVGFAYVWKKRDLDWILVHEVHVRKPATRAEASDGSRPIDDRVTLPRESVPTT